MTVNVNLENTGKLDSLLEKWKNVLPKPLQWDENSPLATDILDARLRAKYYGAKYIIHRPLLYSALEKPEISAHLVDSHLGKMPPPSSLATSERPETEILEACRTCVDSAVASTLAFDGIANDRRLIVTNIFGTAHA